MVIDGVLRSLAGGSNPPATSLLSHFLSEESQEGVKDQDREVVEWRTDYISSQRSLVQVQYRPPQIEAKISPYANNCIGAFC
jgi:hypothetical protein